MNNTKFLIIILGVVILAGLGIGFMYLGARKTEPEPVVPNNAAVQSPVPLTSPVGSPPLGNSSTSTSTSKQTNEWQEVGPALAGTYADADIVTLADGTYRMYAATQPEVSGNNLEIYSATSKDGTTWTKESGTRKTMATFPDVMKLNDGTYRMNFQNAGVIKSATSKDGLTFTDESGTRIDKTNDAGITLDNVAAPSTLKLDDGTYLMVYRGTINQAYAAETVPNKTMGVIMYATSPDGKTWTKKGLAIDTRTDTTLKGWADGPELVNYDGEIRLYFSTYLGVFSSVYKDGTFSKPTYSWQLGGTSQPTNVFQGVPPGDPTLLKVGSNWYMYYGRHPEGIYYAKPTK